MFRAKILPFIAWSLIWLWSSTIRTRFVNREIPEQLGREGQNFLYAFWHGRQFLLFYTHRNMGVIIPASESRDGEVQAGVLSRFGFNVVRGSSKRKGDRALLGMVDGLRKGKRVAIAVDGPRGPVYEVKPGVVYLAGKLNKPIVPVAVSVKNHWILRKIWDQYMLPVPFTSGVIVYGQPVLVKGTDEGELEAKRRKLEEALHQVTKEADAYFSAVAAKR